MVAALAQRATAQQAETRERVRAADPEFTALVDRLRSRYGESSVKVIALVTADGQEFGKVDDDMRARLRSVPTPPVAIKDYRGRK